MKAPPFLLGTSLLFWGWQTGLIWVGLAAGLGLEGARWVKMRWHFSQSDLDRVWNLCVAFFLGATIYAFFSSDNLNAVGDLIRENSATSRLATLNQSKRSLFLLLQWLPIMFLPIALAQAYAAQTRFDLSTFSWWLRRQRSNPAYGSRYGNGLNVEYPYFACCLFAASAGNQRTLWFSAGLMALVVWALWLHRSRSFSTASWIASLVVAVGLGCGVQIGLLEVQKLVQRLDEALLARWSGARNLDRKENQTRIGSIGRLKLSGRIVLRVRPAGTPPALLREASYNQFHVTFWSILKQNFDRITPEVNLSTWILHGSGRAGQSATIAGYLSGGEGILALPSGVARLDDLPALGVATNRFGSVRVEDGPGFVEFHTVYGEGGTIDSGPGPDDTEVPSAERGAVAEIVQELHLDQLTPEQAVNVLQRFFAQHFTYSLWQGTEHLATTGRSALTRFLLENHCGHCEYFATATALILRAAHIPARYATGFAVAEKRGQTYLVRERHAHAWCLAWINGRWRDVDTTPSSWIAAEAERASFWEPIRDFLSQLWFEFSRWRWGHTEWKQYLLWLIVPLLALALAKVLLQRQWTRAGQRNLSLGSSHGRAGLDSEFYAIEKVLSAAGLGRGPSETASAWVERVGSIGTVRVEGLKPLLRLHYRLRFDPAGLSSAERLQLREGSEQWLAHWGVTKLNSIRKMKTIAFLGPGLIALSFSVSVRALPSTNTADVCVYGATAGGVIAAVQAAQMGKSVMLIEPSRHLGGLTTGGLGATDIGNKAAIGGLAREFYHRVAQHYARDSAWTLESRSQYFARRGSSQTQATDLSAADATMWTFEPHVAEDILNAMLRESGARLLLGEALAVVSKVGLRIVELKTEGGASIRARMFIDASYEGDLMARAGVAYTIGREANAQYAETINGVRAETPKHQFIVAVDPYRRPGDAASGLLPFIQAGDGGEPGAADRSVQAYNFRLCFTTNAVNRLPLARPPGYDPARYELLARYFEALIAAGKKPVLADFWDPIWMPNGKTDINNNGAFSTDFIGANYDYPDGKGAARQRIWKEHQDYTLGLLTFLATSSRVPPNIRAEMSQWGPCQDEFRDTAGWPRQLYIREARRMASDYVMTERNCRGTVRAEDAVGLGAYNMDSHNCQRLVKNGRVLNEGDVQVGVAAYPISYGAIVPKSVECANLLVPVCLSATHIAYGSIRMEPVFMILGQSAATAAALAIDQHLPVQKVPYPVLKERLLADKQVLAWPR